MLRFLLAKDESANGPAQRDSSVNISAEDGLDVLVSNSAFSFSATMLGKSSVWGVFQKGVSEGCFRPLGLRDRPAQGNFDTRPSVVGCSATFDDFLAAFRSEVPPAALAPSPA